MSASAGGLDVDAAADSGGGPTGKKRVADFMSSARSFFVVTH